jgi:CRP-like cAMP-binding protein
MVYTHMGFIGTPWDGEQSRGNEPMDEGQRMTIGLAIGNRVLESIPPKDRRRLVAQLKPVYLNFGQILYEAGEKIRYVYFPLNCLISLLTTVDKRRSLEVGMVGNEGMAGMPFVLGIGASGVRALVQGAGDALSMPASSFRIEFDRNQPLRGALFRYTYALMAQISQTAACNRFHEAEARLARWLLMTRERVGSNEFPMTHEFLAHMLGVRRGGVTEAASALKSRGLIDYNRGQIRILEAKGLVAASCSCYQAVKAAFDRAQKLSSVA